jgi:hypothetical protein
MPFITIEPRNPLDVKPAELESFATAVRENVPPGVEVQLLDGTAPDLRRRGVTWYQLVLAQLNEIPAEIRGAIVGILLDEFHQWAKGRFRRKPEPGYGPDRRPKHITIQTVEGVVIIERVARAGGRKLADPSVPELPPKKTRTKTAKKSIKTNKAPARKVTKKKSRAKKR